MESLNSDAQFIVYLRGHRDDEAAWLVYGDWLQQRGDLRGALIALEHAAGQGDSDARSQLAGHREALLGPLAADKRLELVWRWGHVVAAALPAQKCLKTLLALPCGCLLDRLKFAPKTTRALTTALRSLDDGGVRQCDFSRPRTSSQQPLGPSAGEAVAAATQLTTLTHLDLSFHEIADPGTEAITESEHLGSLTELRLAHHDHTGFKVAKECIGPRGAEALAGTEQLASLRLLDLCNNDIGPAGAQAIAGAAHFAALTHLDLGGNYIGPDVAQAIAETRHLESLTHLNLDDNQIGDDGARALAAAPHLASLQRLGLRGNRISASGLERLRSAPHLSRLEIVH